MNRSESIGLRKACVVRSTEMWVVPTGLTSVGERVIALFATHEQARQSARRNYFDFDMVPPAVWLKVFRLVTDGVLMAEFERDLFKDVIHLGISSRKESFAPGNSRDLVQDP